MSGPTQTRQWILSNKPTNLPELSGPNQTFTLKTASLPSLKDDHVLIKSLYVSNDPTQRGWIAKAIDPGRLYVPPVPQDSFMWRTTNDINRESKLAGEDYPGYGRCEPGDEWCGAGSFSEENESQGTLVGLDGFKNLLR